MCAVIICQMVASYHWLISQEHEPMFESAFSKV